MKWSDIDISFRLEDHLEVELSNQNLPFIVKLPIRWRKVAKTGGQRCLFRPHHEEDLH
jgi:hypothetical protein